MGASHGNLSPGLAKPTTDVERKQSQALVESFRPAFQHLDKDMIAQVPSEQKFPFDLNKFAAFTDLAVANHEEASYIEQQLVPGKLSSEEFWRSYFYHLLETIKAIRLGKLKPKKKKKKKKKEKKGKGFLDGDDDGLDLDNIETVLMSIRECFVYRPPPLKSSTGHFCKAWNLEKPMWTGQLRLVGKGSLIYLKFVDSGGKLFAQSVSVDLTHLDESGVNKHFVPVEDSSRYFVVRIQNEQTKRTVMIGFGFRERSQAFDFTAAISDQIRQVRRLNDDDHGEDDDDDGFGSGFQSAADSKSNTNQPDSDLLGLTGFANLSVNPSAPKVVQPPTQELFALAPPPAEPAADSAAKKKKKGAKKQQAQPVAADDDDWGDFSSSATPSEPSADGWMF